MRILACLFSATSLVSALTFTCSYSNVCFHSFDPRYTCNPTISMNDNSHSLQSVSGSHISPKGMDQVQGLKIINQNIGIFPQNIALKFKYLMIISIINCGLTSLSSTDLKPFPLLVSLHVDNNNIQSLSNDLFVFNPKIKTFIFQSNNLKRIGAKLVNKFPSLNILKLNGNTCINGESVNNPEAMNSLLYLVNNRQYMNIDNTTTTFIPGRSILCSNVRNRRI